MPAFATTPAPAMRPLAGCALVATLLLLPPLHATGWAQRLTPPPLAPGEFVVENAQGCAVVGRPMDLRERAAGRTPERHRAIYAEEEYDKKCAPGELLVGPVASVNSTFGGLGEPLWYDFGRRIDYSETLDGGRSVLVVWRGRSASFPAGVDGPEALVPLVGEFGHTVFWREGEHFSSVYLGRRSDVPVGTPKSQRRWQLIVEDDATETKIDCPGDTDVRPCYDLWRRHAGPLIERGQRFAAEARPLVEARKAALKAHLRAVQEAAAAKP